MANKAFNFDFIKARKKWLIGYLAVILAGIIVFAIFGAELRIDFKRGASVTYYFKGNIDLNEADAIIEKALGNEVNVIQSETYSAGNTDPANATKNLVASLTADESISTDALAKSLKGLQDKFKDNSFKLEGSNSVNPTVATTFFAKCIIAVILACIIVIIYVGIRFRRIGGISAGMFALFALLLDCIVAFCFSVFFRLEIDANFMAVILTILGYSLNDTIVIYDRMRENTKLYSDMDFRDTVNLSINQSLGRTIKTSLATFLAIVCVIVVAEFFGITSLRSFAIPMAIGIISGSISSICLSCPLWYAWRRYYTARKAAK